MSRTKIVGTLAVMAALLSLTGEICSASEITSLKSLELPAIIGDNMVLQQGQRVPDLGLGCAGDQSNRAVCRTRPSDDG